MAEKRKTNNKPIPKAKVSVPMAVAENNGLYKVVWYFICVFVAILFIKQVTKQDKTKEDKFSFSTFFSGVYQQSCEDKLLKTQFITDLKKYKDKYEFKFFGKVNLEDFYTGKENYIFGEAMTKAYFGDDYFGEEAIKSEVQKAKFVQDKLKELGVSLLVLLAPGKSSVYTDYLPEYVLKTKQKTSNYETYSRQCKEQGVNFIDFVQYFKSLKNSAPDYPLFSKYGSHWSYYGECVAIDTTIKRLENLMNTRLPHIKYTNIKLLDTAYIRDGDIFRKMNIEVPKGSLLAYPENIGYEKGTNVKPEKILGIGDSYFRGFFYLGAMQYAFDNSVQWYYNNSIVPESPSNPEVWQLDLKTEILKTKAIVLMCNEMNLKNLGNGFIDNAYKLFSDPEKYYADKKQEDAMNTYKKTIRNNKDLLAKLANEAQQSGITVDSLITVEAVKEMHKN